MPIPVSYPGVYIEELPSGVHTIAGVSTSDTAFVDIFARGPVNLPVRITSYADFQRTFGGLFSASEASYAIMQYFNNGGSTAWVVRVTTANAAVAKLTVLHGAPVRADAEGAPDAEDAPDAEEAPAPAETPAQRRARTAAAAAAVANVELVASAKSEGLWGDDLQVATSLHGAQTGTYNLVVREVVVGSHGNRVTGSEIYRNLSNNPESPNFAVEVVNSQSNMVTLSVVGDGEVPAPPASSTADITSSKVINDVTYTTDPAPFSKLAGGHNDTFDTAHPLSTTLSKAILGGDSG